jgi:glutamate-ammonia-ligase adenylyltransferase
LKTTFERIRRDALCRTRDESELRSELLDMREKMRREHGTDNRSGTGALIKHGPGGLVDIEFIAQLGILSSALAFPRVVQATSTISQLSELECIGWLDPEESGALRRSWDELSRQRMMLTLLTDESTEPPDTRFNSRLFETKVGRSTQQA